MKRFLKPKLIFSLVTVILLASALAVSLLLSSAGRSHASGGDLHVFDHVTATSIKFITVSPPNDPRGNYVVFYDPVFDATDTTQIGNDSGICTVVSSTLQECHITFILSNPAGEIAVQGPQFLSGAATTVVATGGTGSFSGQEGSAKTDQVHTSSGLEFEFVFTFQ
jgi:hypothetical protein